jgi:hypothetical protein
MLYKTFLLLFALQVANAASSQYRGFPYGEPCNVLQCQALPWKLKWSSVKTTGNQMTACFKLTKVPCKDTSKYNCCNVFGNYIPKIDLSTNPACNGKIAYATVNGVKLKKVEVATFRNQVTKKPFSEIRLWNVNLNAKTAPTATICVTANAPCNKLSYFCTDPADGKCKYAILNINTGHTCCPTCAF